jgi:hypothetical protein
LKQSFKIKAADGSRTHVSSLEGWGNSRYTTAAGMDLQKTLKTGVFSCFFIKSVNKPYIDTYKNGKKCQ